MIVELSDRGRSLVPDLKKVWRRLADDTVSGLDNLPADRLTSDLANLAASITAAEHPAPEN